MDKVIRNIPLASPDLHDADIQAAVDVLKSGMLVFGKNGLALENELNEFLNCKNAALLSNGTATLHLALLALGIGKGDEVIVPAFSYVATANVVEIVGAKPVFADINPDTFNIDPDKIIPLINSKTKAIIPVHEFGLAADMSSILKMAENNNLHIIEDAACALGAIYKNKYVGTFGTFGSFSFHPRKAITSGEGGALVCNSDSGFEKIKTLRNHGIHSINGIMNFIEAGFNYRMTDFQAALLRGQLKRLDKIIEKRNRLAELYHHHLNASKLKLPGIPAECRHTWQTYHVLLLEDNKRDYIIEALNKMGIGSNYGAQCIPATEYYLKKYNYNCKILFPNALNAYTNGLALPLYEKLNENDIVYIANSINSVL